MGISNFLLKIMHISNRIYLVIDPENYSVEGSICKSFDDINSLFTHDRYTFVLPSNVIISSCKMNGMQAEYHESKKETYSRYTIYRHVDELLLLELNFSLNFSSGFFLHFSMDNNQILCKNLLDWLPLFKELGLIFELSIKIKMLLQRAILISSLGNFLPINVSNGYISFYLPISCSNHNSFGFVIGNFVKVPLNSSLEIWLPDAETANIKSLLLCNIAFIAERIYGYFDWIIDGKKITEKKHDTNISITKLIFASNDFASYHLNNFVIFPREFLYSGLDYDILFEFRMQMSFFASKAMIKNFFITNSVSDQILLDGFTILVCLHCLKVFNGSNFFKNYIFELASSIIEDDNNDRSSELASISSDTFYQFDSISKIEAIFYPVRKAVLALYCFVDKIIKSNIPFKSFFRSLMDCNNAPKTSDAFEKFEFSSSTLLKTSKQFVGFDLKDWLNFFFNSNLAKFLRFNVNYAFSRKRMVFELEFDFNSIENFNGAKGGIDFMNSIPLSIKLQEVNGNLFQYHFQIFLNRRIQKIDIPLHSKIRKPHKRKNAQNQSFSNKEDDNTNSVAIPPLKWILLDCQHELLFGAFNFVQPDIMLCSLMTKEGCCDLMTQLRILDSLYKIEKLDSELLLATLVKLIHDQKSYWKSRAFAVKVLSKIGTKVLSPYINILFSRLCVHDEKTLRIATEGALTGIMPDVILPLKPNEFSSIVDYYLNKSLVQNFPCIIPTLTFLNPENIEHVIRVACFITHALYDMLRFNDNSLNKFSDSFWIVEIINALSVSLDRLFNLCKYASQDSSEHVGKSQSFDDIESFNHKGEYQNSIKIEWKLILKCFNEAIEQIERYVTREHMLPSENNVVMQAIICGPWSIILKHALVLKNVNCPKLRAIFEAAINGIPILLSRYTGEKNYWGVRVAAFRMQILFALESISLGDQEGWNVVSDAIDAIHQNSLNLTIKRGIVKTISENIERVKNNHGGEFLNEKLKLKLSSCFHAVFHDTQLTEHVANIYKTLFKSTIQIQKFDEFSATPKIQLMLKKDLDKKEREQDLSPRKIKLRF